MFNNIGNWIASEEAAVVGWFSAEDKALLTFFGPLMAQVKATALQIGKDDLKVGMQILEQAAMAAVTAGLAATPGGQVAAAEAAFLQILSFTGMNAIHNAEAGIIKAAVAILQSKAVAPTPMPVVNNTPVANSSAA